MYLSGKIYVYLGYEKEQPEREKLQWTSKGKY